MHKYLVFIILFVCGCSTQPDKPIKTVKLDNPPLPIVKVAPRYPIAALQNGIEGKCVIEYKVTHLGTVEDLNVIMCSPEGYFEEASMSSVKKYKYRPYIIGGEAVALENVRTNLRFKLSR